MTSDEFVTAMEALKEFMQGSTPAENKLIESYVKVVEIAVNDNAKMVTWFVFENDFGNNKLEVWFDDEKPRVITTALQLYYFVLKRAVIAH